MIFCPLASAHGSVSQGVCSYSHERLSAEITSGWRRDSLIWTLGGSDIDVVSEIEYTGVDSLQLTVSSALALSPRWKFNVDCGWGYIYDGEQRDSDYLQSGRSAEFSRSRSEVEGWTADVLAAVAYVPFGHPCCRLIPQAGFAWHRLVLKTNGRHVVEVSPMFDDSLNPSYPSGWVDTHYVVFTDEPTGIYTADWYMGWLGACLRSSATRKLSAELEGRIELGNFHGKLDWVLREDIGIGRQWAPAIIANLKATTIFRPWHRVCLLASADSRYGRTGRGVCRVPVHGLGQGCQPADHARWWTLGLSLGCLVGF